MGRCFTTWACCCAQQPNHMCRSSLVCRVGMITAGTAALRSCPTGLCHAAWRGGSSGGLQSLAHAPMVTQLRAFVLMSSENVAGPGRPARRQVRGAASRCSRLLWRRWPISSAALGTLRSLRCSRRRAARSILPPVAATCRPLLQVDAPVTGHEEAHAPGTVNIWTGRVLREYRKPREGRRKEASKYRCLPKADSGETRGSRSGAGYCCLYFARGIWWVRSCKKNSILASHARGL